MFFCNMWFLRPREGSRASQLFLFEYCHRNTQGDDNASTGFKDVCV